MSDAVFSRSAEPSPPVAVRAAGSTIWDADGRAYLDAAGGAVVVGIGHGRESVARVMAEQASRLAYAHGSVFISEPLERYAAALAPHLPLDDPAIYPVSGGSEAMESALKLARSYHLARGETDRWIVIARWGSYHGNTPRRARPVRPQAAPPTLRGVARAIPARLGGLSVPRGRGGRECPRRRRRAGRRAGPGHRGGRTAARSPRSSPSRSSARRSPPRSRPEGYWPAIAEVCRRHGVLLVADEVMTGFGRTGRWFGVDHWGVRPDIVVGREGRDVGLLPVRVRGGVGRGARRRAREPPGFVHGFTYSHHVGRRRGRGRGAADPRGRAPRRRRARRRASGCSGSCATVSSDHPNVGEIRGRGLMVGLELVADRETRTPFPRARARDRAGRARGTRARACCSTRAPASPTARTATRSCSARRS